MQVKKSGWFVVYGECDAPEGLPESKKRFGAKEYSLQDKNYAYLY